MLYPLESKKELFESGPPSPTRQLPICAEQLENSPATRIYKKEKFQAWLTPWCPPPFGAWDALAVAKASIVGLGPFGRHFCTGLHFCSGTSDPLLYERTRAYVRLHKLQQCLFKQRHVYGCSPATEN